MIVKFIQVQNTIRIFWYVNEKDKKVKQINW